MHIESWKKPHYSPILISSHVLIVGLALSLSACASQMNRMLPADLNMQGEAIYESNPLSIEKHLLEDSERSSLIPEPDKDSADIPIAPSHPIDIKNELISVNAVAAPVSALLHALATQVQLQFRVVGHLEKNVTLKIDQKPVADALDDLSRQADFSWELHGGELTVWSGITYAKNYSIDYLNIERRTDSSVGLATQVGTINASDVTANSIANSSQTRVENTSEHRFWDSVQMDIEQIVGQFAKQSTTAPTFTINREAGLLNLHAKPELHRTVSHYLNTLQASARRQVLIEATVVEVTLSDSFEAGVDWQLLASGVTGLRAVQALTGVGPVTAESVDRIVSPAGLISLVQEGSQGSISATLSLLEQFGDVRILSRPRIIALNNQSSVLKVVDNRVYFTVNIERRQSETRDEVVTETEIHTVPVGLVMNVTPQISEHGAVMLNVRPTLSRILGFVDDPNPELAQANVKNSVPEIQVREMESMMRVKSGNMAIIGGLMQESQQENNSALPGLSRIPMIGSVFSRRSNNRRQTELLIVLRPTVVDADTRMAANQ